jgi:hypothetical protein
MLFDGSRHNQVVEATQPGLDVTTLQRLVRLRLLLAGALAQAADTSAIGRHNAVIALDGVCENAMGIALDWLREKPKREFPDKLAQLDNLLSHWKVEGRQGVFTLHTARNQAQHHGVVPDAEELTRWATEADRFVRSLVPACFGRPLQDLHTADAVDDEELRTLLQEAEKALEAGDAAASFEASWNALERARRRWRTQRERQGRITPNAFTQPFDRLGGELRTSVARLDEYVEVSVFATDFGEYVWLSAQRREAAPTTEEDGRRVLVFVLFWILRWESFNARFPEERWQLWWSEQRPPTAGLGYAHVVEVSLENERPERLGLRFQLADIPHEQGDAYGERWDTQIHSAHHDLVQGEDFRLPSETHVSITPRGELTVSLPRDGEVDVDAIFGFVQRLIAMTQELYETRLAQREQALQKRKELAKPYRDVLLKLEHPDVTVEGVVAWLAAAEPRDGPTEDRISVDLKLGAGLSTLDLENLIRLEMGRQDVTGHMGSDLFFSRDAITPGEFAALIVEAVEKLRQRVDDERQAREEQDALDERLVEELRLRAHQREQRPS